MTDARTTQIAIEEWGDGNPKAQATQIAVEMWAPGGSTTPQAIVTQIALEQWALQAPPPPLHGSYHPGFLERWDRGSWDHAHWDGQLGLEADTANVVVTGNNVLLKWGHSYVMDADPATITITGNDVSLGRDHICIPYQFKAEPCRISLDGKVAFLQTGDTIPPPGRLTFGIPRVTRGGW